MTTKDTIKYKRAYIDDTKNIVNIGDVSKNDDRKQHTYKCISCGKELVSVCGPKRVAHFRHKDDEECDPNRYLHNLAEMLFKQRFDSKELLCIYFPQMVKCSEAETCSAYSPGYLPEDALMPLEDLKGCIGRIPINCNLKKYYDVCTLEKEIKGFRADILLENSKGIYEPLLIEIYVTHKCTNEKINSGLKILEIPIRSEKDAEDLLTQNVIVGDRYNFETPEKRIRLHHKGVLEVYHLYSSAKSFHNQVKTNCGEIGDFHHKSAVLEVRCDGYCDAQNLYQFAINNGIKVRSCYLCKFYKNSMFGDICCRYKTKGTPHFPFHLFANLCCYFKQESLPNTDNMDVLYIEKSEEGKNLILKYKNIYDSDVMELLNECISAFENKNLNFKLDNSTEIFCVSDYYQNKVLKSNSVLFSSSDTNNSKQLRMVFVRKNEYMRNITDSIRTIYVYNEVLVRSKNGICITEDKLAENFVNFKKIESKEVHESDILTFNTSLYQPTRFQQYKEISTSEFISETEEKNIRTDVRKEKNFIDETEEQQVKLEDKFETDKALYQELLNVALNKVKTLYDEANLYLQLPEVLPFEMKCKYPYCKVVINADNLYYSLIFNEKDEFLSRDLVIRFICNRAHNKKEVLVNQKEIHIYINKYMQDVLDGNCIYPKDNKIVYFNF